MIQKIYKGKRDEKKAFFLKSRKCTVYFILLNCRTNPFAVNFKLNDK